MAKEKELETGIKADASVDVTVEQKEKIFQILRNTGVLEKTG